MPSTYIVFSMQSPSGTSILFRQGRRYEVFAIKPRMNLLRMHACFQIHQQSASRFLISPSRVPPPKYGVSAVEISAPCREQRRRPHSAQWYSNPHQAGSSTAVALTCRMSKSRTPPLPALQSTSTPLGLQVHGPWSCTKADKGHHTNLCAPSISKRSEVGCCGTVPSMRLERAAVISI